MTTRTKNPNNYMTPADYGFAAARREEKTHSDETNTDYLFNGTWTELLTRIASGEINAQELAKKQLANRGLDINGKWIGFEAAKKAHNLK